MDGGWKQEGNVRAANDLRAEERLGVVMEEGGLAGGGDSRGGMYRLGQYWD